MTEENIEYVAYDKNNDILFATRDKNDFDYFLANNSNVASTILREIKPDTDDTDPLSSTATDVAQADNIGVSN